MAFSLVQWQYKAEASGSRAFRLKSVAIRRLDFARDMQDAPKNTGPSRTVGRHRKWDWEWCTIQSSNVTQPFSEQLCHCRGGSIYPSPLHSVWSAALWGMGLGPLRSASESRRAARAIPREARSCLNSQGRPWLCWTRKCQHSYMPHHHMGLQWS